MLCAAMAGTPFVTVVLPCLNEAAYVEACVRTVLGQDYPADRMEVLVADGGSDDGTLAILARLAEGDGRLRVIANPRRIQSAGLNEAIRAARGSVVVRMDVHCEYAPDYVRRCVEVLEATGADNVGGAQRPRAATRFQRLLAMALGSPLAVGGARYRSSGNEGQVDTVFLGAFRRSVFERVGLYDPAAVTNEDAELNQRILAAGGRIHLSRSIVVHYFPRETLGRLARQYYGYGRGRARTLCKHRGLPSWRPLAPFALVMAMAAMALVPALGPLAPYFVLGYAAAVAWETLRVGRAAGPGALLIGLILVTMHASHGAGFAAGLLRYLPQRDWPEQPERLPAAVPAGSSTSQA
jgi:succinoglycan biosynthesis protein ExoA